MSPPKVSNVQVLIKNNPAGFQDPFKFDISFNSQEALAEDLFWKVVYVGSADTEEYDQVLDYVQLGPIPRGPQAFELEAKAPEGSEIPGEDIIGVTVLLICCSYRNEEFIRIGYYINNEYVDEELREDPPADPKFAAIRRDILVSCPRVTHFTIKWDDEAKELETNDEDEEEDVEIGSEEDFEEDEEEEEEEEVAMDSSSECSSTRYGLNYKAPYRPTPMQIC